MDRIHLAAFHIVSLQYLLFTAYGKLAVVYLLPTQACRQAALEWDSKQGCKNKEFKVCEVFTKEQHIKY